MSPFSSRRGPGDSCRALTRFSPARSGGDLPSGRRSTGPSTEEDREHRARPEPAQRERPAVVVRHGRRPGRAVRRDRAADRVLPARRLAAVHRRPARGDRCRAVAPEPAVGAGGRGGRRAGGRAGRVPHRPPGRACPAAAGPPAEGSPTACGAPRSCSPGTGRPRRSSSPGSSRSCAPCSTPSPARCTPRCGPSPSGRSSGDSCGRSGSCWPGTRSGRPSPASTPTCCP